MTETPAQYEIKSLSDFLNVPAEKLSERTILDMEKRGEFPRRFAITPRLVAWDLREIEKWIEERKAAAMQPMAPGLQAAAA